MSKVLTADQTAETIAQWLGEALAKLGQDEFDEAVLMIQCRGAIVKLTAEIYRP